MQKFLYKAGLYRKKQNSKKQFCFFGGVEVYLNGLYEQIINGIISVILVKLIKNLSLKILKDALVDSEG